MDVMILIKIALAILSALIVGLYTIPIVIKVAIKKDLVAKPNHRTSHTGRIPNVGGISIFIAFIIAFLFVGNLSVFPGIQYFLLAVIILFFIGVQDDILIISAKRKLFGEIMALLAMIVIGDIRITELHGFFDVYHLSYTVSVVLTLFVVVVIINAMNLIDGIDGLAASIGMVISLFYAGYFLLQGTNLGVLFALLSFSLFGALIPFFLYNVFAKRNKVFMGDAGALVLGFILAVLTIEFVELNSLSVGNKYHVPNAPVMAICILIVPLFDTLRVFTIRIMQKRSPFSPDKNHLHHMLLAYGFKHKMSTSILVFFNLLYIGLGLLCRDMPKYPFLTLVFVSAILLSELLRYMVKRKKVKEHRPRPHSILNNPSK